MGQSRGHGKVCSRALSLHTGLLCRTLSLLIKPLCLSKVATFSAAELSSLQSCRRTPSMSCAFLSLAAGLHLTAGPRDLLSLSFSISCRAADNELRNLKAVGQRLSAQVRRPVYFCAVRALQRSAFYLFPRPGAIAWCGNCRGYVAVVWSHVPHFETPLRGPRLERRHHVDLRHQSSAAIVPPNGQQLAKNAGVRSILTTAMYVAAAWSDLACASTYRAPVAHEWFPRSLQQCSWAGPRAARMAPLPLHTKAWPAR
jgi:hypothetical protein